ncbi:MAG TPA: hypothetical protein PLL32_02260 [Anaeromyxobacteraceae bacterium]|nr:hypothetical protein [Anaeromyxobacteraceae bacterium]
MKRLVVVAVGAILLLGVVAVAAILIATGGDLGWSGGAQPTPATGPTGAAPAPVPVPAVPPPGPTGPAGYPPGPRRIQLAPKRVAASLSEPLAPCFRSFPPGPGTPATLTLDLEAQAGKGGFAVLDATVQSWGSSPRPLVDCAIRTLRGQVIPGGGYTPGERALFDLTLDAPASVQPPPPEPPSSTLPASRQERPARRGGGR